MKCVELIIGYGEGIGNEEDWGLSEENWDSNMKDEFDFMEPLVGWGEGIRSAEDVDIFDERPDL